MPEPTTAPIWGIRDVKKFPTYHLHVSGLMLEVYPHDDAIDSGERLDPEAAHWSCAFWALRPEQTHAEGPLEAIFYSSKAPASVAAKKAEVLAEAEAWLKQNLEALLALKCDPTRALRTLSSREGKVGAHAVRIVVSESPRPGTVQLIAWAGSILVARVEVPDQATAEEEQLALEAGYTMLAAEMAPRLERALHLMAPSLMSGGIGSRNVRKLLGNPDSGVVAEILWWLVATGKIFYHRGTYLPGRVQ